jgi:Zn-dependent protease
MRKTHEIQAQRESQQEDVHGGDYSTWFQGSPVCDNPALLHMSGEVFFLVIQFLVLLLSLSVHESAHAWSADRLGDPTARYLGRVSLNPIVHIDPFGTILFPLLGMFALGGVIFGWAKPVPVNVSRLRNQSRDYMLVAAAGPVSNLILAAAFLAFLLICKFSSESAGGVLTSVMFGRMVEDSPVLAPLMAFAYQGIIINVVLAVFNLIPVAPLDGAAVLSGLLPRTLAPAFDQMQSYGFILLIGMLYMGIPAMLYTPVLNFVLSFLRI